MVLFRMKVLPTIYTCNQLIKHHGIFVNNKKISLANFRVELGDIVSIPQTQ
jgi:ribosomal protein S4